MKATPVAILSRTARGGRAITDHSEQLSPAALGRLHDGSALPGFALFPFVIVFLKTELQLPARILTTFNYAALLGSLKPLYCPLLAVTLLSASPPTFSGVIARQERGRHRLQRNRGQAESGCLACRHPHQADG